jgi:molecular chaperone DnaK
VKVKIRGKEYTPEQVSSFILQDLKKTAEDYLGEQVTQAVITVPAYFNDAQRQATKTPARSPGSRSCACSPSRRRRPRRTGWTRRRTRRSSCSTSAAARSTCRCLDVGDGVFEVLSINGDTHLGGDDFDEELINYVAEEFRKQEGIDLRKDPMALQRLKEAGEKAKIELSNAMETRSTCRSSPPTRTAPSTCRARSRGRSSSSSSAACSRRPASRSSTR